MSTHWIITVAVVFVLSFTQSLRYCRLQSKLRNVLEKNHIRENYIEYLESKVAWMGRSVSDNIVAVAERDKIIEDLKRDRGEPPAALMSLPTDVPEAVYIELPKPPRTVILRGETF